MTAQEELVAALGRLIRAHERLRDETLDALFDSAADVAYWLDPTPAKRAELLALALQVAAHERTREGLEGILRSSDQQASLEVLS